MNKQPFIIDLSVRSTFFQKAWRLPRSSLETFSLALTFFLDSEDSLQAQLPCSWSLNSSYLRLLWRHSRVHRDFFLYPVVCFHVQLGGTAWFKSSPPVDDLLDGGMIDFQHLGNSVPYWPASTTFWPENGRENGQITPIVSREASRHAQNIKPGQREDHTGFYSSQPRTGSCINSLCFNCPGLVSPSPRGRDHQYWSGNVSTRIYRAHLLTKQTQWGETHSWLHLPLISPTLGEFKQNGVSYNLSIQRKKKSNITEDTSHFCVKKKGVFKRLMLHWK